MWGSWTPAKVKMARLRLPAQLRRGDVKDVGVICVDSGYDIHVAGAAGLHRARHRPARPCRHRGGGARTCRRASCRCIARRRAYLERTLQMGREDRARATCARRSSTITTSRKALFDRFVLSQTLRAAATPGPSAPPARTCTNSCRSRAVADRASPPNDRAEDCRWKRPRPLVRRRAGRRHSAARRAHASSTPRREIAVFRTASDDDFRAREQMPAQGRPLERGHRPRPQGRPVRCTTGSSIWRPARRPAPTRAARGNSRSKIERRPHLSRHGRGRAGVRSGRFER